MQALLFLFVAIALIRLDREWRWALPVALLAAAWAATTLPDLDTTLRLGHRSGLTHSILPAGIASLRRRWWPIAAGLALGLGLHLSADLFPNAMRGFATVKLPGPGTLHRSIGPDASYLWIAINAALALAIGTWLTFVVAPPRVAAAVIVGTALLGLFYLFRTDGGWWALMLFAALGWVGHRLTGGRSVSRP